MQLEESREYLWVLFYLGISRYFYFFWADFVIFLDGVYYKTHPHVQI